ncbi:MAG: efflux RND transporter periplasmic adaptor subunit [Bacillota bacterium]
MITLVPAEAGRDAELSGVLQAGEEAMVSFEVAGRILEMHVSEGDEVKEGEVLARVDAAEYSLQVVQAKAGLDKAEVNYRRQGKITPAYNSSMPREPSRIDFENTGNRLAVAEAGLVQARQSLALLQDKTLLKSPVSGKVISKLSAVGQLVSPGTPVYRIGRLDPLKVVLPVPDKDVAAWRARDEVILSLYGRTRRGKVARVFLILSKRHVRRAPG